MEETGGPKIPFRLGRSDATDGSTSPPDGRLPDADKGSHVATRQHIRDVFYRMGKSLFRVTETFSFSHYYSLLASLERFH